MKVVARGCLIRASNGTGKLPIMDSKISTDNIVNHKSLPISSAPSKMPHGIERKSQSTQTKLWNSRISINIHFPLSRVRVQNHLQSHGTIERKSVGNELPNVQRYRQTHTNRDYPVRLFFSLAMVIFPLPFSTGTK